MLFYVILLVQRNYGVQMSLFPFGYRLVVLTTILLYVLACDPLPPAPAMLKVWICGMLPASSRERGKRLRLTTRNSSLELIATVSAAPTASRKAVTPSPRLPNHDIFCVAVVKLNTYRTVSHL